MTVVARPPSLLDPRRPRPEEWAGGVAGVLLVPLLGLLAVGLAGAMLGRSEAAKVQPVERPPLAEVQLVEARFVRKGRRADPDRLPSRRVPRKSTAPRDVIAARRNPRANASRRPPRNPNAAEDLIRRLGDRAQAFAEIAEEQEQEGDPEGIEEGTEQEAREGDLYAGKLYVFFRRGWTVPTVIERTKLRSLVAEVDVQVAEDLRIVGVRLRRGSGEPLFDRSVLDQVERLRDQGARIPEPPASVEARYRGRWIGLRFRGRDAR